jgi:hypothetical protein
MKVNFKRNFFDGEKRWRAVNNPHNVPDAMKSALPSDAEIIEEAKPKKPKRAKKTAEE